MARVLGFLIRYFSNYYTLHRSDLAARAAPLDPCLLIYTSELNTIKILKYLPLQNVFYLSDTSHKMLMLKQNEVYRANDEAICRDWVDAINHSRYVCPLFALCITFFHQFHVRLVNSRYF